MNVEAVLQAIAAIAAPVATVLGLVSRKRRLRATIRENLSLIDELNRNEVLREHTPVLAWMYGRVAVDVAKLAGQQLGTPKKPIPKGSVVIAAILTIGFAGWTYLIIRNGFVWYSVFPGTAAALMAISTLGMTTNRELPPEQDSDLPPGATPIRSDTASEQVATSIALAADEGLTDRLGERGQAGVALRFFGLMREGRFEDGVSLADSNWLLCRIQSWLWNNRETFGPDLDELEKLATSLAKDRQPVQTWNDFVATESGQFRSTWGPIDPNRMGVASRERKLARDYALVILVPVGESGGYFVTSATLIQNALTFVVHRQGDGWLVANHLGTAPPTPGWPPAWWTTDDPAVESAEKIRTPRSEQSAET